ncbi:MAG TPA: YceI family protein [Ilumatobacter sp.]|nr:YceI family protein [Ilumatobacter sp.]
MSTPQIPAGTWNVDPTHSRVGFVARHMMVSKVRGSFADYTADVVIADNLLESSVSAVVQVGSVDTGNADRDGHLRTNDFFDVENYPTLSFRSTSIIADGDDYQLHGELTIKGITKPVEFDLEFEGLGADPWGGTRAGFEAKAVVDRTDFGVEFNAALETGGVLLGDKVTIELDIQLVKA